MYAKVFVINHFGQWKKSFLGVFWIVGFHQYFMYVCQCPSPHKKTHFLGCSKVVVYISGTCMYVCMWMSSSVNRLGIHCFLVYFYWLLVSIYASFMSANLLLLTKTITSWGVLGSWFSCLLHVCQCLPHWTT